MDTTRSLNATQRPAAYSWRTRGMSRFWRGHKSRVRFKNITPERVRPTCDYSANQDGAFRVQAIFETVYMLAMVTLPAYCIWQNYNSWKLTHDSGIRPINIYTSKENISRFGTSINSFSVGNLHLGCCSIQHGELTWRFCTFGQSRPANWRKLTQKSCLVWAQDIPTHKQVKEFW